MPVIGRDELAALIPHKGTMCLLDEVVHWDRQCIECVSFSHRREDNPLRYEGRIDAVHAVEYGAQAMAVHGGLLAREQGRSLKPGYIAALRDINISRSRLDSIAEPLQVSARQLMAAGGNLVYRFEVRAGEELVASGRVTVIEMEDKA